MRTPGPRTALLALTTLVVLAGCADDQQGGADAGGAAAGGTTMQVLSVTDALESEHQGSVHVAGLLIDDGSGWHLCEEVMESYPPQCGGASLLVEDVDPADHVLEEEGDVRWQTDATVVGEIEGDTLIVTGSAAAS